MRRNRYRIPQFFCALVLFSVLWFSFLFPFSLSPLSFLPLALSLALLSLYFQPKEGGWGEEHVVGLAGCL